MSQVPGGSLSDNNVNMPTLEIVLNGPSFTSEFVDVYDFELKKAIPGWTKYEEMINFLYRSVHVRGCGMDAHTKVVTPGKLTVSFKFFSGVVLWMPYLTAQELVADVIANTSLTSADVAPGSGGQPTLPVAADYDAIVFIGASIIHGLFGNNNAVATEATAALGIPGITVYGNGHSGKQIGSIIPEAAKSAAMFPSRTLFVIHAGGNNLSAVGKESEKTKGNWDLATPLQRQTAIDDYTALREVFNGREDDVIFCPLTMRDYNRAGFVAGTEFDSNKFSSEVIAPHYTPRFQNSNGFPVLDLYGMLLDNEWYLSEDGIHMSISGTPDFRENIVDTLRTILVDEVVPTPYTHNIPTTAVTTPKAVSIGFQYNINSNVLDNGKFTAGVPVTLATDDRTTEVTVTPTATGTIGGRSDGYVYGKKPFNWTLDSDPAYYGTSWGSAGEEMHLAFAGLQASTTYNIQLQAYREASDDRFTELVDQSNASNIAAINSSTLPPNTPASIQVTTDGAGALAVTVRAQAGSSYCYASSMRLVPA